MRYLLLMWGEERGDDGAEAAGPGSADGEPCWLPWHREMTDHGVVLHGGGMLHSSSSSTTVRTDGVDVLVTDGPFAETKEQIGGYDVIECADLDEAIYAASRHPVALAGGTVEVRPIVAD